MKLTQIVTRYPLPLTSNTSSHHLIIIAFCFLLSALCLSTTAVYGQSPNCYRITFSDKNNTPYSVEHPEEFLSPRAIAKRERFNIPIIEQDLPINPQYIDAILNFSTEPSQVISKSKWDNSVVVFYPETENCHTIITEMINNLSFVKDTLPVAYYQLPIRAEVLIHKENPALNQISNSILSSFCDYDYGNSIDHLHLHNGEYLHKAGFCGDNMLICALDVGWDGFDSISYFQHLFQNGQLLGTRDLIPGINNIFVGHYHGTGVTSEIVSNIEGKLVGTAPKADYYFIRSDDPWHEQLVEEDFWAYAAEIADSLGTDVLSSSVGYIYFDYEWQNIYTQENNNGMASIASRAASILTQKGVIVVQGAGNEGVTSWRYILRPADAFNILAVGAVRTNGVIVPNSSYGPSADGRVKPDVASVGWNNWVINPNGHIIGGNTGWMGTSCATPIISGLAACLWQALPQYSSLEIMNLIRQYGDMANNPDDRTGYGIPDFYQCYLDHHIGVREHTSSEILVYPNPTCGQLRITNYELRILGVEVYDVFGRMQNAECRKQKAGGEVVVDISPLPTGVYFVRIFTEKGMVNKKVIKY